MRRSIRSALSYNPRTRGIGSSVGLISNGNGYGIREDLIFSFPCRSKGNGKIEIVKNVPLDSFLKDKMALTEKELLEERELVAHLLKG